MTMLATTPTYDPSTAPRTFLMPPQLSNHAAAVDWPFWFITWVSVFFFVLIIGLMCWFMYRYRREVVGSADHNAPTHHTFLEIGWTVVPLILVIYMFYIGFKGAMNMYRAPEGSYQIDVTAYQWAWGFTYPNGWTDPVLHVPAGEPVRLVMTSRDVIHSLFIPDFRVKMDVVPGRYSELWFIAENDEGRPTSHHLFCTEYCGLEHSTMITQVVVHPDRESFEAWLADASDLFGKGDPMHEIGEKLYRLRGCITCHSLDGSRLVGPSFEGLWTRTRAGNIDFADGSRLSDHLDRPIAAGGYDGMPENYLRESIMAPNARIVATYGNMPRIQMRPEEIDALIAFIRSIDEPPAPTESPTEGDPE